MKRNILTIAFLLSVILCFSQGITEISWDKYNVQTIEVMGHKFSVGDTLTFAKGANPNGDFLHFLTL